jgi:N-acetylmuramoyl-L-alanine amidase
LVFYSKTSDVPLAQALHDAIYPALERSAADPAGFIDFGVRRFRAGVLRRSTMPAGLVEPLFMSNPGEAGLLVTPIYTAPGSGVFSPGCPVFGCRRGQIAQALYRGVLSYFGVVTG